MSTVFPIIMLVILAVCAFKESSFTGIYKANKAYGRITAYLAFDLTAVGIAGVLSLFVPALKEMGFPIPLSLGCLALGIILYILAYIKCPQPLKKMCIPCMIVSGMGITLKIALFFLPFVWKLSSPDPVVTSGIPETVQDSDGNTCRTRVDGDFIYISRPDGSEVSTRRDYIGTNPRANLDVDGIKFHW